jgi:hypothetical protein
MAILKFRKCRFFAIQLSVSFCCVNFEWNSTEFFFSNGHFDLLEKGDFRIRDVKHL